MGESSGDGFVPHFYEDEEKNPNNNDGVLKDFIIFLVKLIREFIILFFELLVVSGLAYCLLSFLDLLPRLVEDVLFFIAISFSYFIEKRKEFSEKEKFSEEKVSADFFGRLSWLVSALFFLVIIWDLISIYFPNLFV